MLIKRYLQDLRSIESSDIFLLSFPKSGNTRFRMAMAKYLELNSKKNINFSYDQVNTLLPELGKGNIGSAKKKCKEIISGSGFPTFIKSHLPYSKLKIFSKKNPIIFIHRKNPEVLMSYYDYTKARNIIPNSMSFKSFLRSDKYGINSLLRYTSEIEKNSTESIGYDELIKDDINSIITVLKRLNITFNEALMQKAIIKTRREEVQKLENNLDNDTYNFAAKKKRKLKSYFDTDDIDFYNLAVKYSSFTPIKDSVFDIKY